MRGRTYSNGVTDRTVALTRYSEEMVLGVGG